MAFIYSTSVQGWTAATLANAATGVNSNYHALRNAAITDVSRITEVFIGGEATSSAVNRFALRRISTNAGTPTNVAPGVYAPGAPASSAQQYTLATTGPTVASTTALGTFALNAFGGIVRIATTPGQEPVLVGTVAPNGEAILATVGAGTSVISTNILFESA
jgi:hypothetical protein